MKSKKRILVLAPHTDDGEFGCGGTIARMTENNKEVFYVAFSAAEKSVPACMDRDILRNEVKKATAALGIKNNNLIVFNYEVRDFPLYRQNILEDMIRLNRELKPELVFLPSPNDTHQDHQIIAREGFRAFKKNSMLGYEVPWNNLTFNTTGFVFLEERHLQKKIEALRQYKSQQNRNYATEEFIKSLAHTRGIQIGYQLAEVFEVVRWIVGHSL